jgi:AraC-like DNA-binding protein
MAFRHYDGFFEFPLISNSPETIIESMSKMPFVHNDKEKEVFGSKNPFVDASVQYHQVEEGLWIFNSRAKYKENVNYLRAKEKLISADYFNLYLEVNINKTNHKNVLLNGVTYSNSCWVLHKPFDHSTYCKFKDCSTTSLVIHFTKTWLKDVLSEQAFYKNSKFNEFFNSKADFVLISENFEISQKIEKKVQRAFDDKQTGTMTKADWQVLIFDLFKDFTTRFNLEEIHTKLFDLDHTDRVKLAKVDKILMDNLYQGFVGIDYLANEVGVSATKMKQNFKLVYGDSVFQYFRNKQMQQAKEVLDRSPDLKIQDLASMFGYENMTKFSNAFKGLHGVFPSNLKGNNS